MTDLLSNHFQNLDVEPVPGENETEDQDDSVDELDFLLDDYSPPKYTMEQHNFWMKNHVLYDFYLELLLNPVPINDLEHPIIRHEEGTRDREWLLQKGYDQGRYADSILDKDFGTYHQYEDGKIIYYQEDGKIGRVGGPAVIYPNGDKYYYKDGKIHRDKGSEVEKADGSNYRIADGVVVKTDNTGRRCSWIFGRLANIKTHEGEYHYKKGKLHGAPAVKMSNGDEAYYTDGKLDRLIGPALITANGEHAYFSHGERQTREDRRKQFARNNEFILDLAHARSQHGHGHNLYSDYELGKLTEIYKSLNT